MATLTRTAKPGNLWTPHDLRAFNIRIIKQDVSSFFNLQELPTLQNIPFAIWNNVAAPTGAQLSKKEQLFFSYLDSAMNKIPEEESFVSDFAVFLLGMFDYDVDHLVAHRRREMPFYMCGTRVKANADAIIIKRHGVRFQYVLLVQEAKEGYLSGHEPEPGLIAEAIAAFYHNNRIRKFRRMPPLESQTFPAMTIAGTTIIFYKITITQELLVAVEGGTYPENSTIVHEFLPPIPLEMCYFLKGMVPLENRRILLQCFEAFKQFVYVLCCSLVFTAS
ncbi:hypothetical protein BD779DRAFT_216202 [Infundibulicybe gibba]|nr:hypothetical protein BD779DRAFT_216202 [Infundibulicybe gibba]